MSSFRLNRVTVWALVGFLYAFAGPMAGEIVRFTDGRVLEVARVKVAGETIELEFDGGGLLAVPAWRIKDWSRLAVAQPARPTVNKAAQSDAWKKVAGAFAEHIERAATAHEVDPVLLTAMARTESAFDPQAVSPKGAGGLMQLMPQTAERFGVANVFDVSENVHGGARYMSWLLARFEGNTELALAGYNAGENAVDRYKGIPPYPETKNYVKKVMLEAARLRPQAARGSTGAAGAARIRAAVAD